MKKRIFLLIFIVLTIILSIGAISANNENETNLYSESLIDVSSEISTTSENSNDTLASYDEDLLNGSPKTNTTLESSNKTICYGSDYSVILKDFNGEALANQKIIIKIGTKNYEAITNSNGIASVKLYINPDLYIATILYDGTADYNPVNLSCSVKIIPTIISKDINKYYKASSKYTATFLNTQGEVLKNTNVKIKINGKTYTAKTNNKGVATLAINLKPGNYFAYAYDPITGFSLKNRIKVLSTISANDISKVYSDGKKFTAKFLKSNGKALANKYIKFRVKGKTYKIKTNSKGVASLKLTTLKKGTYKIKSYNKDGLTKTNKVKVVGKSSTKLITSSYIFLKRDSKKIRVKLLNKFGYAPGSGKIIKFKINGKTYSKKTNSKGIATLRLPNLSKGAYTVKYNFAGNKYYYSSSASNKLIILSNKNSELSVKSTTTFGHGAGTHFKIALTANNIPIEKRMITIKVNGNTYTKTTNSKGIASLPINLVIGNYTVNYLFKGESKINSINGSTNIVVKERCPTSIIWKSGTSIYQGNQNFKVLLLGNNSKALAGKSVKLTINSRTYLATTSSNGYASFNVNLNPGNFPIIIKFAGDNSYSSSSNATKINVKSKYIDVNMSDIIIGAQSLKKYYAKHNKLPSTVMVANCSYSTAEFLYLMSKAIDNLGKSKNTPIKAIKVANPTFPTGNTINSKVLYKTNYLNLVKKVANYITSNGRAPNYASSSVGNIIYYELANSFSKILDYHATNNKLPNYVTINYKMAYSNNIITLAKQLTNGLTSNKAKANALFLYVRDKISYSFYYNTVKGASRTLTSGSGNCCDQAQLLVALARSAGLSARFATGYCKFTSGNTYGHVWVQIHVNGAWHALDTTSSRNTYDKINNWNTNSYTSRGIYNTLPY